MIQFTEITSQPNATSLISELSTHDQRLFTRQMLCTEIKEVTLSKELRHSLTTEPTFESHILQWMSFLYTSRVTGIQFIEEYDVNTLKLEFDIKPSLAIKLVAFDGNWNSSHLVELLLLLQQRYLGNDRYPLISIHAKMRIPLDQTNLHHLFDSTDLGVSYNYDKLGELLKRNLDMNINYVPVTIDGNDYLYDGSLDHINRDWMDAPLDKYTPHIIQMYILLNAKYELVSDFVSQFTNVSIVQYMWEHPKLHDVYANEGDIPALVRLYNSGVEMGSSFVELLEMDIKRHTHVRSWLLQQPDLVEMFSDKLVKQCTNAIGIASANQGLVNVFGSTREEIESNQPQLWLFQELMKHDDNIMTELCRASTYSKDPEPFNTLIELLL